MTTEYLAISGRYMLLSKEEEIYLGRRIQKWLTWEGECPKAVERSGKKAREHLLYLKLMLLFVMFFVRILQYLIQGM